MRHKLLAVALFVAAVGLAQAATVEAADEAPAPRPVGAGDDAKGKFGKVDPEKLKALKDKFGGKFDPEKLKGKIDPEKLKALQDKFGGKIDVEKLKEKFKNGEIDKEKLKQLKEKFGKKGGE